MLAHFIKSHVAAISSIALATFINSASAAVLLTDNFDTVSGNTHDPNEDLALRQGGTLAPVTYSWLLDQMQLGNTGTDVGQPGGPSYGGYALLSGNGRFQSDLDIAGISSGPLTI